MRLDLRFVVVGVLAATLIGAPACSDNDDDDGGGQPDGGGEVGPDGGQVGPDGGQVSPDAGAQVGGALNIEIQNATVPETGNPTITFRVTDGQGNPISTLATEIANEEQQVPTGQARPEPRMRPRFSLAQLEDDGTFTHYYEVEVASQPFTGGTPALPNALQPRVEPGTAPFPVAQLDQSQAANGIYTYTFSPPTTASTKLERTRTHRVGIWATRTASGQASQVSQTRDFNPSGAAVTKIETVTNQACNTCHTEGVVAHDNRRTVELCSSCHASDRDATYQDPETGADLAMRVMIHKIHYGANLPSVENGTPYQIVGFRQTVHDYSEINFPQDIRNCTACHSGQNADRWQTAPGLDSCGSCHDNVAFDGSAAAACTTPGQKTPCNHPAGPLPAVANCAQCHTAQLNAQAHTPIQAQAAKYRFEILSASLDAQRQPVVNFRVVDTATSANVDIKTNPEFNQPAGASRLAIDIGWPTQEYTNAPAVGTMRYGQPIQVQDAKTAAVANADGTFTVTVPTAIPAEVTGTMTAVLEGHPATTTGVRLPVPSAIQYFDAAGGTATPRREVVSVNKCNSCHGQLTAHGFNRNNSVQVCAVCHNTNATDGSQRPAGVTGETSINLSYMVHLIHASELRPEKTTIYGFGNTPHEFPLEFTGQLGNCNLCHEGQTFQLPLNSAVTQGPTTDSAGTPADYSDNVRLPPNTATCTSCHGTVSFTDASLPACNTVAGGTACKHSGGLNLPDSSCVACHGAGGVADTARVHPITP